MAERCKHVSLFALKTWINQSYFTQQMTALLGHQLASWTVGPTKFSTKQKGSRIFFSDYFSRDFVENSHSRSSTFLLLPSLLLLKFARKEGKSFDHVPRLGCSVLVIFETRRSLQSGWQTTQHQIFKVFFPLPKKHYKKETAATLYCKTVLNIFQSFHFFTNCPLSPPHSWLVFRISPIQGNYFFGNSLVMSDTEIRAGIVLCIIATICLDRVF